MHRMPRLLAIVVRLTLVFALVVNGIGVAAYAMHAQAAERVVSASPAAPCHDHADAAGSVPTATEDGASTSTPHDCCGKTCACDFFAAAALAPLAWSGVTVLAPAERAARETGALLPVRAVRPLRPPIA